MGLIELSLYDRLRRLKANRDLDAVAGNLPIFNENGDLVDSGTDLSDYEPADATILKKADVVDGLESEVTDVPLSANQGRVLKDAQDVLNGDVETEGSVAKAIDDAVSPLEEDITDLAGSGRTTETVKKNADDITKLNGGDTVEGSVANSIKTAIEPVKGAGYTEGSLKTHEDRLDTLEGTGAGSVAKAIDNAVSPIESQNEAFENLFNSLTNPLSIKPVLNLDFANRKVLDPRITFARASTGRYYDGKTFAKAEENLFRYSQNLSASKWEKHNCVISEDAVSAPDGTLTADKIIATVTTGYHQHYSGFTTNSGKSYIVSYYVKAAEYTKVIISEGSRGRFSCTYDLTAGTVGAPAGLYSGLSASIVAVIDGWYRVSLKFTATYTESIAIGLMGYPDTGVTLNIYGAQYTGDGLSGYYGWGYQLEERDYLTAYTTTTDQPITNYIPVLKEAGVDEARFDHDPVSGESLGLLIEEQRTNLFLYSEQFDNAYWVKNYIGIMVNCAVSPLGALAVDKIVETTDDNIHGIAKNLTGLSPSTPYTYSIYAKAGERSYLGITLSSGLGAGRAYFNLSNGSLGDVTKGTAKIESVGNGWYRCSLTCTSAATAGIVDIFCTTDNSVITYTGDGFSGIYIWGAQIEAGSFPTSYIPTAGSQVIRSADSASMTGTNFSDWYRQGTGSIFVEAGYIATPSIDQAIFNLNDATAANSIQVYASSSGVIRFYEAFNGGLEINIQSLGGVITGGVFKKCAIGYDFNNAAFILDGTVIGVDTTCNIGQFSRLQLQPSNSHIKKLAYYNQRLSNADLQTLTT